MLFMTPHLLADFSGYLGLGFATVEIACSDSVSTLHALGCEGVDIGAKTSSCHACMFTMYMYDRRPMATHVLNSNSLAWFKKKKNIRVFLYNCIIV